MKKEEIINILKKITTKKSLVIISVVVAVFGVYGSFHFYNKYKSLNMDAALQAKQESDRLISVLGNLMELPKDETPTIATISDKDKLKDQIFFAQAQNGDILFAYTTSMKAILYRPSSNKIINVASITINQTKDVTGGVKKTPVTSTPTERR